MVVHVLACDYDGTIADHGRVAARTGEALGRVRESGRKLVLVTGRMLADLRRVYPGVDDAFDAVVAENGAVLYFPTRRETRVLGDAPEPALLEALERRGVRLDVGRSIVATDASFAEAAVGAIQDAGVERTLVFNKGSLMLLPGGVTKGTGLAAALAAMELSPHNTVGVGDGENDHDFLSLCECAVAVADAIPALRTRADLVTREPGSAGFVAFVEHRLLEDVESLLPTLARHRIPLGTLRGGQPVAVPAHGTRLLIVGPSASGKSTVTGVLVERLVDSGRSVLLLDPEGDYQTLTELPAVLVLGGPAQQALPEAAELEQLLQHRQTSVVLNLSAMSRAEKVDYASMALATAGRVRMATGKPHWVVIDEAHHVAPAEGSPAGESLGATDGLCLITLGVDDLARDVRPLVNVLASTDLDAFRSAVAALGDERLRARLASETRPLARHEALLGWLRDDAARPVRFRVADRQVGHQRHIRKYTEGELPPDRSFYFRGPVGKLNLRAANLTRFCELAEGVDDATWTYHLKRGEYSSWIRGMIKDPQLAGEVAQVEQADLDPRESRRRVIEAVRSGYTV